MILKKIIMVTFFVMAGMFTFAAGLKPNEGYLKLKWGTSTDDAKKAGYTLSDLSSNDKEYIKKNYSEGVTVYNVVSKDKTPSILHFYYYMGRLFQVTESLPKNQSSRDKLEKRYGKFSEIGVFEVGNQYVCVDISKDGNIDAYWLIITQNTDGSVITSFFDWNIAKNVSVLAKQLAGADSNAGNSFVEKLTDLAEKLVQNGSGKPTYAFLALTSDDGNALVENYVTDALTEAMFNTGKIKIVERASIEKILSEQQFQDSALVNESTASEIGNLTGANYVCYGTVKDLGNQITLNVKVVEVSTAELCSMGRETLAKDDYLNGVGFEARKNGGSGKKSSANTSAKTAKHVENNRWTYTSTTNDFDGYTEYIFTLLGADERRIAVIYQRNEDKYKSKLICGIKGGTKNSSGFSDAEIKEDNGKIIQINSKSTYYYIENGVKYRLDIENEKKSGRSWLKIFKDNNHIVFRAKDVVTHFETAGLLEKMEEAGVSWEELDEAMKNQEF